MTDSDKPMRLLLVNETCLMGNVIAAAPEAEPDLSVVGCVSEAAQALRIVQASRWTGRPD